MRKNSGRRRINHQGGGKKSGSEAAQRAGKKFRHKVRIRLRPLGYCGRTRLSAAALAEAGLEIPIILDGAGPNKQAKNGEVERPWACGCVFWVTILKMATGLRLRELFVQDFFRLSGAVFPQLLLQVGTGERKNGDGQRSHGNSAGHLNRRQERIQAV